MDFLTWIFGHIFFRNIRFFDTLFFSATQLDITFYPLMTPMGLSLIHFLLMPAAWHVFTTSVTSLYDSGASSITNLGEATLMAMPLAASLSRTSW